MMASESDSSGAAARTVEPSMSEFQRLSPGIRAGLKAVLLGVALVMVLLPRNRISPFAYPLLFGAPLIYAAVRREGERAFLLWTTYAISFAGFVVLRRLADNTGVPWQHTYVIAADRAIGFGSIPTVVFQRLWYSAANPTPLDHFTVGMHLSYYLVPPAVGIILWYCNQVVFERYMFAISATYLLGLIVHFAVPTIPPWMAGHRGYVEPIARVLYDRLNTQWPSFYRFGNSIAGGNDVAAMPSLHMGAAFLVALGLARIKRVVATLGIAYALAMGFSLVYTGEHYVIDLLGGILIAWASWLVAPRVLARLLPPAALSRTTQRG
jgi:membrane-associated phospholipid phosphatase